MAEVARPEIGLGVCRRGVEAVTDRSLEAIAAAVARCDYEAAATLAIARAKTEPLPIEVAIEVLPGIELPAIVCALIACASGDRTKLVTLLHHRRFPQTRENGELEAIVLYAAWLAGARPIPELRRLAARSMFADGFALLAAMAKQHDDPNVTMAVKHIASFDTEYAKEVAATGKALRAQVADVIAALPPDVVAAAGAVGFTVRAAQEPGRNDPCPCGSGLKYKKCHADKPVEAASPIAGVSWEAFLTTSADQMTVDHVGTLPLRDLARVSLDKLSVPALTAAGRAFLRARQWAHALRAIAALHAVDEKVADELRDTLILEAQWCNETELARAQIALLPEALRAVYMLDESTDPWRDVQAQAAAAVKADDRVGYVDLAHALMRLSPSLGILAARACIGAWKVDDAELLLEAVEETRDALGLPPGDPAWDVLDTIAPKKSTKRRTKQATEEDSALQKQLAESAARAADLERSLSSLRSQLDDARTQPVAALARKTENRDALESKIEALEGLIREGNAERRDLRKALAASQTDDDKPAAPVQAQVDDEPGESLPETTRGIAIPRFDRRITDALDEVPQAVAAEAMRTIGSLSAGDGFAWMGVKQAKDMVRQVLMARVGIHHRLLFRVDAGILDVLDLVTREQLMTTLKRIRLNRT